MADRPCKPDADAKRLWQLLLPDTPFPACGTQEDAAKGGDAARYEGDARWRFGPPVGNW